MNDLVLYEIAFDSTGLDAPKIQAAQSCVRLANDGCAGGPIAPFYSVEEASHALNSVATRDQQTALQLTVKRIAA